jgi:hypothetical protein
MTHDILQSDINLAIRLKSDQRPDEEIIQALVQRGVDPVKAAQLLDDLRNGRNTNAGAPLPAEFGLARRSRSRSAARRTGQSPPARSSEPDSRRERPTPPTSPRRKKPAVIWVVLASILILAIAVIGIVLFQRSRAGSDAATKQTPKAASVKADTVPREAVPKAGTASQITSSAPLVLELRTDGLHIGGTHVTPGNILAAVASSLGGPTRTNRVGQTGTVIYAYDQQGLLIYLQPGGHTNSIILDCEANGGTHGTTSPFAGSLTVEGKAIRADTDPQTLTAIKQLALGHPGADSGIWGGRYNNLQLVFAYLKSPQRLSLIEIDLK